MKQIIFLFLLLPCAFYTQAQDNDSNKIFTIVQQAPEFKDLYKYIGEHLNYTAKNGENSNGTVYVSFVVEKDGSVSGVHTLNSVGHTVDSVSVACIKGMPKWKPGMQNGHIVRVQYNIPIRFDNPVIEQNSVNPTAPPRVK